MRGEQLYLTLPTIGIVCIDGRKQVVVVPAGEPILVLHEQTVAHPLLNVSWDGKIVAMFAQDIDDRGVSAEPLEAFSA